MRQRAGGSILAGRGLVNDRRFQGILEVPHIPSFWDGCRGLRDRAEENCRDWCLGKTERL